jgi:hypothetical protein
MAFFTDIHALHINIVDVHAVLVDTVCFHAVHVRAVHVHAVHTYDVNTWSSSFVHICTVVSFEFHSDVPRAEVFINKGDNSCRQKHISLHKQQN